jgi:hypothetical protein
MTAGEVKSFFGDKRFFWIDPLKKDLQLGFAENAQVLLSKMDREVVNGKLSDYIVEQ